MIFLICKIPVFGQTLMEALSWQCFLYNICYSDHLVYCWVHTPEAKFRIGNQLLALNDWFILVRLCLRSLALYVRRLTYKIGFLLEVMQVSHSLLPHRLSKHWIRVLVKKLNLLCRLACEAPFLSIVSEPLQW